VTGATFLPDNSGLPSHENALTRSASVTFKTIREAANAVSWMHSRFYGGKQIKVRWEGEGFPRKVRRTNAPVRLDFGSALGMGPGISSAPYSSGQASFALPTPPITPFENRMSYFGNNDPPQTQRGPVQGFDQQVQGPFQLQQSHLQKPTQSQQPFQAQPFHEQAIGLSQAHQQSLADQFLPFMQQRYNTTLAPQTPSDPSASYNNSRPHSSLQVQNHVLASSASSLGNSQLSTPQRSDIDRNPSPASNRSFEGVFPTALTPMSWSGISENKTAPPSPGPFTPFSPIQDNEGFEGTQIQEENDVLGILAGLTCDDDDREDEGEEEKMVWAGSEVAKDYGPIGQERRNSAVEA
jgi:hypothetical protein